MTINYKPPPIKSVKKNQHHKNYNRNYIGSTELHLKTANLAKVTAKKIGYWTLKKKDKTLVSCCKQIVIYLTNTEWEVIFIISSRPGQPVKNETIIECIRRDPDKYKGLCMCMSRLQAKFKKFSCGEKLFRAVRNRGYYLTQYVHIET